MEDRMNSNVYIVKVDDEHVNEPMITKELLEECKRIADKYPLKGGQNENVN